MRNGKNICKYLKDVRKNIADENNIPLEQSECTYKGECLGTCPHCEAEVQYIEHELSKKGKLNLLSKAAAIAGITLSMAACHETPKTPIDEFYEGYADDTAYNENEYINDIDSVQESSVTATHSNEVILDVILGDADPIDTIASPTVEE